MYSRILASFALVSLITAGALAADDSFVGKWKLNPDKSQFNGLTYKIEDAGGGQYKFSFGDDVETLTLDGKGHVTRPRFLFSVPAPGPVGYGEGGPFFLRLLFIVQVPGDGSPFISPYVGAEAKIRFVSTDDRGICHKRISTKQDLNRAGVFSPGGRRFWGLRILQSRGLTTGRRKKTTDAFSNTTRKTVISAKTIT